MNKSQDYYESFVGKDESADRGKISDTSETSTVICRFVDKPANTHTDPEEFFSSDLTETATPKMKIRRL